jgi:KUP system potassium uptake protein
VPYVPDIDRVEVRQLKENFWSVIIQYGFKDAPNIPAALALLCRCRLEFSSLETSYFIGRETLIPRLNSEMAFWREKIFVAMFRNAGSATAFFKIPSNRGRAGNAGGFVACCRLDSAGVLAGAILIS